jgi:hypothetical protein
MKSIYYIIIVPLSLRQDIYINYTLHEASFSQNKLIHERYQNSPNVALITYCFEAKKSENVAKIKRSGILYLYHKMIQLSKQRAEYFTRFILFTGLSMIIYFFLILVYEFYFIDIFTPYINYSSEISNANILFLLANIPMIVLTVDASNTLLNKRDIYIKLLSEYFISFKYSFQRDQKLKKLLHINYLIDYKIDHKNMNDNTPIPNKDKIEIQIMINILIAIFLSISIYLTYNRVYTDSSKIDIPQTIESIKDGRKK